MVLGQIALYSGLDDSTDGSAQCALMQLGVNSIASIVGVLCTETLGKLKEWQLKTEKSLTIIQAIMCRIDRGTKRHKSIYTLTLAI